jgi:hypothetical protein
MPRSPVASLALAAVSLAPSAAADVLVVDAASGPYFALQAAVDAALPGDTLLVRGGSYATCLVNAKPLSIVGDAGADVQIAGAVRVRSLPAGTLFALSNVTVTGTAGTLSTRYGLYLSDNQGSVRVANAFFTGAPGFGGAQRDGADGLYVELSPDVVATRCGFFGGQGLNGWEDGVGKSGSGVRATSGSTVALWDCVLEGGHGQAGVSNAYDAGLGGHGLHASGSTTLFLSGCFAYGGNGGNGANPAFRWSIGGTGGDGARLDAGALARVLELHAAGGQGGENWVGLALSGFAPDGLSRSGPGTFVDLPGTARELQAPAVVRQGAPLTLTFRGQPGDRIGLIPDRESAHAFLGGLSGVGCVPIVRPLQALVVGTVPAGGELSWALPVDWLEPGEAAAALHLQAIAMPASGNPRLGSALTVTVLDASY